MVKNLKKNWLAWEMTWGIWQIFTWALKVSKLELWWDPLVQSRKYLSLKFTDKVCVMTIKNDAKMEEKRSYRFKLTWGTSQILTLARKCLKNFCFNWLLVTKIYIVWTTKVQRSSLSWNWRVVENLKKNWLAWKMTWGIRQIFTRALESVKIGALMGSFCAK